MGKVILDLVSPPLSIKLSFLELIAPTANLTDLLQMTHVQGVDLEAFMDDAALTENAYQQRGDHFLPEYNWSEVFRVALMPTVYQKFPYSKELRSTVRYALLPEADKRPQAATLLEAVRNGRDAYIGGLQTNLAQRQATQNASPGANANTAQTAPTQPQQPQNANPAVDANTTQPAPAQPQHPQTWEEATRLYFRANEINDMPVGNAGFPAEFAGEIDYHLDSWADPDWPALRMPLNPDALRPIRPTVTDELVAETIRRLWPNQPFVDWPPGTDFARIPQVMYDIAEAGLVRPSGVQRTEQDYTNMGHFEILKAIEEYPDMTTEDVNNILDQATCVDDLLMVLRTLDGNAQPEQPPPRRQSYELHYVGTLRDELDRRVEGEGKGLNKAAAIDRLAQLDQNGERGDGAWRRQKPIPTKNRKRKRAVDDVGGGQAGAGGPVAPGTRAGAGAGAGGAPAAQDTRSVAQRMVDRKARRP